MPLCDSNSHNASNSHKKTDWDSKLYKRQLKLKLYYNIHQVPIYVMAKQHKKFLVPRVSETSGGGDYASNSRNASNSHKKTARDSNLY